MGVFLRSGNDSRPLFWDRRAPRSTIRITVNGRAPSDIRIPISRVRWDTEKLTTPEIPTAASVNATNENATSNIIGNRRDPTES